MPDLRFESEPTIESKSKNLLANFLEDELTAVATSIDSVKQRGESANYSKSLRFSPDQLKDNLSQQEPSFIELPPMRGFEHYLPEPKSELSQNLTRSSAKQAFAVDTIGRCWQRVADVLDKYSEKKTSGVPAYESATRYLDNDQRFSRLKLDTSNGIPVSELRPGDIFTMPWTKSHALSRRENSGHVAIYLGEGYIDDKKGFIPAEAAGERINVEKPYPVEASDHLARVTRKSIYNYERLNVWRPE